MTVVLGEAQALDNMGEWINFPSSIPPNTYASFTLVENAWFTGTAGTFNYYIGNEAFGTYQKDGYIAGNQVNALTPSPGSPYTLSWSAVVANGPSTDHQVARNGHPVTVIYTLKWRNPEATFTLINITATSDHPVRNSRKDLITGLHTLWDKDHPSIYPDGKLGSFQPNIFAYDFVSPVAQSGFLDVTLDVSNLAEEMVGKTFLLYGVNKDGKRVLSSGWFVFIGNAKLTIQVHAIVPEKSKRPFPLNTDVTWYIDVKEMEGVLEFDGPRETRLELYWIAKTLHPAFEASVPVIFLRNVLSPVTEVTVNATHDEYYQAMTQRTFSDYHKQYDTISGSSSFGCNAQGGNFNQWYYLRAKPNSLEGPGSMYPFVNCMDQAAMLQLECSLLGGSLAALSWLYQMPFGYINTAHLVGLKDAQGAPLNVNNPFYGTDITRALTYIDDIDRVPFYLHVYIGHSRPLRPNDGIYDACGGPHLGTETLKEYIEKCIDTETALYNMKPWVMQHPGNEGNVATGDGVISIDGQEVFSWSRTIPPLTEPLSHLVSTVVANTMGPLTHAGWAHLPIWLNATLGDAWDVQYEQVTVSETGAQALWLISNANIPNSPIHVHVNVVSTITQDGYLDMEPLAAIVKGHISDILMSTECQDIWTSGTLPGIEGISLQYADHIAAGRIVFVAGNAVMDISGMMSYDKLLPYALKLLNRTVRRNLGLPLVVPIIQKQVIRMRTDSSGNTTLGEPETETGIIRVGIHARFSVVFSVSCKIATANAGSKGHGVLFDRYIVEELDNQEGCIVEFLFVAWEVGHHRVRVCVADLETMVGGNSDLEVEVVGA